MKKAVVYARYSCDKQTEQSIEGQLRVCEDYAKANDIVIVDKYIDQAMSGTNDNRPDFQRMLKDSRKKQWNYVLVYKLDRFSRDKYESVIHKRTLRNNGVKVLSVMENIPDTPEGLILESLLEGMNQYYSEELSQKVKRGMKETRIKGNFTGGHILYGYKVVDKKILIDEDKSKIVKYIFDRYAEGKIVREIIEELTKKGIYNNKGKPFYKTSICQMLSNEKYIGILRYEDEIFKNIYPQIISNETFELVQERLAYNKKGRTSLETVYLLRNKLKCGYCGNSVISESGTSANGNKIRYYKCATKKKGCQCQKKQERKEIIEDIIVNTTIENLSKTKQIEILADKIIERRNETLKENFVLQTLNKNLKEIEKSIDNLLLAIEQGIITQSTKDRLAELENKKKELSEKIILENSKEHIKLSKDEIVKFILSSTKKSPRLMLDYLLKEVIIYNDKIEIYYNYTNKQKPDEDSSQAFLFCKKIYMIHKVKKYSKIQSLKEMLVKCYI